MSSVLPCPDCGLFHQCLCGDVPLLNSNLHISLLTHQKEFDRPTNTGRFIAQSMKNAHRHQWQRTEATPPLREVLNHSDYSPFLLYPATHSLSVSEVITEAEQQSKTPYFIVLDGTWQEARKMERKSAWLASVPRVALTPCHPSEFHLRKNQKAGSLCTLEVIAELLDELCWQKEAEQLRAFLNHFMAIFHADKSGHKLKKNKSKNRF
ncbi:tRNA-uridine aminocarboxypropyltransferase [Vibrio salinus]|uniref:tRNA-uridine aminocarboxypropyltransferase n=1 Tax=Vibrio salinus TaxID=2899784 RepID=UPI001E645DDC|nr:DTW domain-containing protein [Vibrio salinus]MCE0493549.1 DTW domain-containing protein [Vibrio salinus]